MHTQPARDLRSGNIVQVRSHEEILATLDEGGSLDGLVFMPEMLDFIGRRFRVFRRLEKTCIDSSPGSMGEFHKNDVVFLEGLRCSGAAHDGCGRFCLIFWKEAWLSRADSLEGAVPAPDPERVAALAARLRTRTAGDLYVCQSSDLKKATHGITKLGRVKKAIRDVEAGTYSAPEALRLFALPVFRKMLRSTGMSRRIPLTDRVKSPKASLGLRPGDLVEIKSPEEIAETLDIHGRNRGLQWSYDLAHYSGRVCRVTKRLNCMIIECTGEMLKVSDTVLLDGITCPCRYVVGGCPRADPIYWREIWLRKIEEPARAEDSPAQEIA